MPFKKIGLILVIVLLFSLSFIQKTQAGFGISPPYVINHYLSRGSSYEQKIVLSRSDPNEDLKAEVTIEAPEIEKWLSIKPAKEFILPKGEQQVPMFVVVNVPKDAQYKDYKGIIRVRTTPLTEPTGGQVRIVLGARIDVDLTVSKEVFIDFKVRGLNIPEVLLKDWPLSLFSKIKVLAKIENLGNVSGSPTKVGLEIFDLNEKNLLYSGETKNLEKIEPFKIKEITANFPVKVGPGQYWAKIKIFKGEEIKYQDKLILTIKKIPFAPIDYFVIICLSLVVILILVILFLIAKKKQLFKK
jgi:hypothetical protein